MSELSTGRKDFLPSLLLDGILNQQLEGRGKWFILLPAAAVIFMEMQFDGKRDFITNLLLNQQEEV